MKKSIIYVISIFLLMISVSGCSNNNPAVSTKQEPTYVSVEKWGMKIWLPEGYIEETLSSDNSYEQIKVLFSNNDQGKDDYLLLDKKKIVNENLDSLYLADACGILYSEVGKRIEEESGYEWLTELQTISHNIPTVQAEACDNEYNYNFYYFLNTEGELIRITHVHKKEGFAGPITYVFNDIAHSVRFSKEYELHARYASSSGSGSKCVNCGGLGYVKQYYGSSWLDAFLAGEPNYELIKCPLCHGTGRSN